MLCELYDGCGFFKKYSTVNKQACDNYRQVYCEGQKPCKRKEYLQTHGERPSDEMLPNGRTLFA